MTRVGPAVALVSAALVWSGCEEAPDAPRSAPLTCSGAVAGGEVVFGYQQLPSLRVALDAAILGENGTTYFFVDDACDYWIYRRDDGSPAGPWAEPRTGRLDDAELAVLNTEILVQPWSSLAGVVAGDGDGGTVVAWYRSDVTACVGFGCRADRPDFDRVRGAAEALLDQLYADATPVREGPMRVDVMPYEGPADAYPFVAWSGSISLTELERSPDEIVSAGGRPALDPADADAVRAIAAPFVRGDHGSFYYHALPVSEGGRLFHLYAREVVPHEDERGLIRAPAD